VDWRAKVDLFEQLRQEHEFGIDTATPSSTVRSICRNSERMIVRAIMAGVPFHWVAADTVYGVSEVEQTLRRAGKGYVLGVAATQTFHSWRKQPVIAGTAEALA
jgi:hypothetical protein